MMIAAKITNFFHLVVENTSNNPVAIYLYRDSTIVEKRHYKRFETDVFALDHAGQYSVAWFERHNNGAIRRGRTAALHFSGFSDASHAPTSSTKIALLGLNKRTIYAGLVLQRRHDVIGLVDPTDTVVGSEIFGIPVISHQTVEHTDAKLFRHESSPFPRNHGDTFSLEAGRADILSYALNMIPLMDLYRLSHQLYLDGLLEGANHIQGFIFSKFNSRVPFKARIGQGTRIGVGGIGVVIHPDSVIGENCVIAPHVLLGGRAGGHGTPVIGNNVWFSPGAKFFGGSVGDNVVVGANAVVLHPVESNCVVAGVPAKVISRDMERFSSYIAPATA